jgi:serine/threonine protein phosphatase PrpC
MMTTVSELLNKHDPKTALDKLFTQLVAKDQKDRTGFDNMTALLLQFQ